MLANTVCDQGRYEEAERLAERSRELSADDDFASQASWRMAQARVLAHRGAFEDALRLADEAVEINGETDYVGWQGDGLEVKGIVLAAAGRGADARAAFEESLERYERKGNVVAAARNPGPPRGPRDIGLAESPISGSILRPGPATYAPA